MSTGTNASQLRMTRVRVRRILPALALALITLGVASPSIATEIVGAPRPNVERQDHTATRFGKGRVLLVGGRNASGPVAVAEIYDPVARTFTVAATSLEPRADHAAVLLNDGRVLVMGGRGRDQAALNSTEFFDPDTKTFSSGPSLNHARFGHTATVLADGRVVVVGGDTAGCAEIFEPANGQFHELERCLTTPRRLHATIVLLQNGDLLIAGGIGLDGASLASAEILDLETLVFSPIATSM